MVRYICISHDDPLPLVSDTTKSSMFELTRKCPLKISVNCQPIDRAPSLMFFASFTRYWHGLDTIGVLPVSRLPFLVSRSIESLDFSASKARDLSASAEIVASGFAPK